ncbi:MAG: DUF3769 domain-containing protein [Gloeomargarita sp. SKYBB_i_bin120]|nr:DUF3769 domain-containing protein [Gloeomargarita sp. SKYG98]MCS7291607.1 DUF3769 domain-containing protein [Gloeomargarita sp. SKYB120]MDW8177167.1 DUF3769 domain-containing protein [Gloeomargarita sp. SKYBB_i_bin120]
MPYFAPPASGVSLAAATLQEVRPASVQDIDYTRLSLGEPLAQAVDPQQRVQVQADRQTFNEQTQVFTATGNAVMRYRGTVLRADEIEVNLLTRKAVATGEPVVLTRGDEVLQGKRLEYDLATESGVFFQVRGGVRVQPLEQRPAERPVEPLAPPRLLVPTPTAVERPGQGLRRFTADELTFDAQGNGTATNLRITNDPFDPPELELRAWRATLTRLPTGDSEVRAEGGRLVFDQRVAIPLLRDRVVISRRGRDPAPIEIGYDREDLGGLYIGRPFEVVDTPAVSFRLTPLFLVQRTVEQGFSPVGTNLALRTQLSADVTPQTNVKLDSLLSRLDFQDPEERLRVRLRLEHRWLPRHSVIADVVDRERVFNGSLGFETVRLGAGVALASSQPIPLGPDRQTQLQYLLSARLIRARSDDTTPPGQEKTLMRYQAAVNVNRSFLVWQGKPLPPTATEGLRFSPVPITPFFSIGLGALSFTSFYSNGKVQTVVGGDVGFTAQVGRFAKNWLDYTALSIFYSPRFRLREKSPFFFDRQEDQQILRFALTQQLYGPLRASANIVLRLDGGTPRIIDATYGLEYSRRTYGIALFFNPERAAGGIVLRVSDFNWVGEPEPFLERERLTPL